MSFYVKIETAPIAYLIAHRVCKDINAHSYYQIHSEGAGVFAALFPRLKSKRTVKHFTIEPAAELLSDDHDPDETVLRTDPTHLGEFASALEAFHKAIGRPFSVFPAWIGEKPVKEKRCSIAEFADTVRQGRIENKVKYLIG